MADLPSGQVAVLKHVNRLAVRLAHISGYHFSALEQVGVEVIVTLRGIRAVLNAHRRTFLSPVERPWLLRKGVARLTAPFTPFSDDGELSALSYPVHSHDIG